MKKIHFLMTLITSAAMADATFNPPPQVTREDTVEKSTSQLSLEQVREILKDLRKLNLVDERYRPKKIALWRAISEIRRFFSDAKGNPVEQAQIHKWFSHLKSLDTEVVKKHLKQAKFLYILYQKKLIDQDGKITQNASHISSEEVEKLKEKARVLFASAQGKMITKDQLNDIFLRLKNMNLTRVKGTIKKVCFLHKLYKYGLIDGKNNISPVKVKQFIKIYSNLLRKQRAQS